MEPATGTRPPPYDSIKSPDHMVTEFNDAEVHPSLEIQDATTFYTSAYSHGYTEGYIAGFEQPQTSKPARQIPIAIVGMSCRLPGNVTTPDEFWELCSRARNVWSEIPKERFDSATFYHPNPGKSGCTNAKGGYFLKEDVGLFDAPFFSLTAQEAISMDPQARILLECTFEALESAGFPKHEIVGKDVGVFVGGSFSEYESQLFADTETNPMYQATGNAFAMQAARLSHFFDLRGPSFTMDTACSSTLVALHQACQSLRNGECQSAIVGGCHLNLLPEFWISMSQSRLFSDAGRSFSFDSRGTGYGRGEGCGMVILKPLDQALRDNDNIRSVIVGSGINQDGRTPGITMPNGAAQESLMRQVYETAGLDPKETGYVEAHGTGTKVGDPIEATALHSIFGEGRTTRNPLIVGSIKSNIGHLEAASGIMAVIKTALMLERGFILPNFDYKKPNEKIPFAQWNLKVPTTQRPWPRGKRFASINNFGFGGTNAHVIMEKAPLVRDEPSDNDSQATGRRLFVLSANDKQSLEILMKNIGIYLEQRPEIFQNDLMDNVAYTLGERRSLLQWRVGIPASSSFELIETLNSGKVAPVRETEPLRVGYIFTGQGAQWYAMGRELYAQFPIFAASIDTCDRYLTSLGATFSLRDELNKDENSSRINEAQISQPSCTAIQISLTDLLRSWNVLPSAVTGHSSGEIAAAYAAAILPLEACMAASYYRGLATIELRENFPDLMGSMMAVGCTKEDMEPLLQQLSNKNIRIACYNSPTSLTISGDSIAIDELQGIMEGKQMFNRKLQVNVAYHSSHMELVAENYRKALSDLPEPKATSVQFFSSLYGKQIDGSLLLPTYWVENLTQAVRFSEALTAMCEPVDNFKTGVNSLIELGPHSALGGPVKQILKACGANAAKIPYSSALVRKRNAVESVLELASSLFVKGHSLNMAAINHPRENKRPLLLVDLPRYPWNHQIKYWHEPRVMRKHKNRSALRNDLLGVVATYSNDLEPTWRNILRADDVPWLRHHKIQGLTLFPMSAFLAMAVEAASQYADIKNVSFTTFELRDVSVCSPLMITDGDIEVTLQLRQHQDAPLTSSEAWNEFKICSWTADKGWTEHCKGLVGTQNTASLPVITSTPVLNDYKAVETSQMYETLTELGVAYGSTFQGITNCQSDATNAIANITVTDTRQEMPLGHETTQIVHPAFLEQLIEMYWPILGAGRSCIDTIYLPSSIERMTIAKNIFQISATPGNSLRANCERVSAPTSAARPIQLSMHATSPLEDFQPLIMIEKLTVSPILESNLGLENEAVRELCYKIDWELFSNTTNDEATLSARFPQQEIVISHGDSHDQVSLASELAAIIQAITGNRPITGILRDLDTTEKLFICISELETPLLSRLGSEDFELVQKAITNAQSILWVVHGAYLNSTNPDLNMITGLSRSIRSETLLKFATLDLDAISDSLNAARLIMKVFEAVFNTQAEINCELEFMERQGQLFTPRMIDDPQMNERVYKEQQKVKLEMVRYETEDRSLQLAFGKPGVLETLHFVDQDFENELLDDEIEIKVKATSLNIDNVAFELGREDRLDIGYECSGIVTRVGSTVGSIPIGSHIFGVSTTRSAISTNARLKAAHSVQFDSSLSFGAAASLPIASLTAYYALTELARLEEGDKILVNGATSPIGQVSITIAQRTGVDLYVVVDKTENVSFIHSTFGLPEDHIVVANEESIRCLGRIVQFDVVLNCVPTSCNVLNQLWMSLDGFGSFVDVVQRKERPKFDGLRSSGNKSFLSVDMAAIINKRPTILQRLLPRVTEALGDNDFPLTISFTDYRISEVEAAFKIVESGGFDGKIVILPQPGDEVKAVPSIKSRQILRADASYVLIGGTGGLGRSMARWMVSKGARNLVLVSRSGSSTAKVQQLIDEVAAVGAVISVRNCDVARVEDVKTLLTHGMANMPPIRGVIHGAMVLNDVLFEKMTYDQYTTVIESKVKGAWNFHNALLERELDFFVAISSAAGAVGNRGQAAYSAANTFLNAFVQYRQSLGLPASSIDLTAVSDVGYLAEDEVKAAEVSRNLGSDTICEAEVLALLGAAIDGTMGKSCSNHSITGVRITPEAKPFWTNDAKFKHLRSAAEAASAVEDGQNSMISYHAALKASTCLEEAQDVVCKGLLSKLPSVLMLEAEDMDVTKSLANYALDSLVAIEVRNYITREFEANLQVLELLSSGSIETLAKTIVTKSKLVSY